MRKKQQETYHRRQIAAAGEKFIPLLYPATTDLNITFAFALTVRGLSAHAGIDPGKGAMVPAPEIPGSVSLERLKAAGKVVEKNRGASLIDLGDGIACLEFHTKMNTMGGEVLEGINKAIDIAEKDFRGLVIGNQGPNFSAGANLAMIFMFAVEQEYDEIDFAVRYFQNTMMRVRYSAIPVVVAPHGLSPRRFDAIRAPTEQGSAR